VAANAALLAEAASAAPAGRAEAVAVMFRNMHTVKDNARTHGLLTLAATVHDNEQTYDDLRQGRLEWDAERLDRELLLAQQAL
ncbi:Hpt domain-containing protein, partial [Acinetobacter baumannii]